MEPTARHPDSIAAWLAPGEWETLSTSLSRLPDADHHPTTIPVLHFSSPTLGLRLLEGTGTRLPSRSGGSHHVLHLHDVTARIEAENRTRRSEEAARIINSLAGSLVELESEEDVLWNVARDCVGRLGLPDCVVYVLDERRNVLVQRAAWGAKAPVGRQIINPIEIPLGHGIVGAVGKSGRAELVPDTRLDPRYLVDDAHRLSELAVPILLSDRVIGVIDVEHPDAGFLDEHHLEILTALAALLANKLVRVRAEEALRTLNSDLERRVHERTAEIQSANARLQQELSLIHI
jgi:putative methionine-R-sulfoxide reductase with GAF domain